MFSRYRQENSQQSTNILDDTGKRAQANLDEPYALSQNQTTNDPVLPGNHVGRQKIFQDARTRIHKILLERLNLPAIERANEDELRKEIHSISSEFFLNTDVTTTREDLATLVQDLTDEVRGFGPLEPLLADPEISDILVNGPRRIFIERQGKLKLTGITFNDERHLQRIIDKAVSRAGRRIDESNPYVDVRLPNGTRLNAVVPPIALGGPFISVRKFRKDIFALEDLLNANALSPPMAQYLQAAVFCRLNIVISGGTGSGKTTALNALSRYIDSSERILTIEDTAELQLQQIHVVRLESRPANAERKGEITQRDCLRNALRMRPDRIIIGETRGDEVIEMLQAMNTGHDGSMTTIHANSARESLSRLENLVAMSGASIPIRALRAQISSAINLIVQIARLKDGSRKIISICEVTGMEGDIISTQEIFKFQRQSVARDGVIFGRFGSTGLRSHYLERFREWGHELPAGIFSPRDEGQ